MLCTWLYVCNKQFSLRVKNVFMMCFSGHVKLRDAQLLTTLVLVMVVVLIRLGKLSENRPFSCVYSKTSPNHLLWWWQGVNCKTFLSKHVIYVLQLTLFLIKVKLGKVSFRYRKLPIFGENNKEKYCRKLQNLCRFVFAAFFSL